MFMWKCLFTNVYYLFIYLSIYLFIYSFIYLNLCIGTAKGGILLGIFGVR